MEENLKDVANFIKKRKLTRSLFYYDIITFLFIFISVFIVFESIIKKIFVDFSTDRFSIHYTSLDFDMSVAFDSLEEKISLDYEKMSNECVKYLVRSYLVKAKYDNSLIFFLFPDSKIISGKKNDVDYVITDKKITFESFLKYDQSKLTNFTLDGVKYIGIVRTSKIGIRENRDRFANKLDYPIIVLAEREKDFFFVIDLTRWFFIAWVFIILGAIAFFKIRLTERASNQIKNISTMLSAESKNIREKGIIGESLKRVESEFQEVFILNESSLDLNSALSDLKNIVMGVTNKEFFTGIITNDKSITEQHKAYCAVMFLDIKGFTSISEKHNEHSMKIGIHIFSSASNILKRYGGEIRKLLGDAALITFKKYSTSDELVAFNALSAAIEILESVKSINSELNKIYNPQNLDRLTIDFNFRVGLDVGEINEGLYGTPENFEYGIIGDTVNTASRFEALNKQYYTNLLVNTTIYDDIKKNNEALFSEINKKYLAYFFRVDKARPKGKQSGTDIFTIVIDEDKAHRPIGWTSTLKPDSFSQFSELFDEFTKSIALWKEYIVDNDSQKETKAYEKWYELIRKFAKLENEMGFKPANQFIKLMLKDDDFTFFTQNYGEFIKKDKFDIKIPDSDWLNNKELMRELDK